LRTPRLVSVIVIALLSIVACRRDMQDQPKYKPLGESRFFADGRDSRPIPPGTIARDEIADTDPIHTGSANGAFLETIPLPVNATLLERGRDRFNIYCSPCHGQTGNGYGMVRQRGFWIPANLHTERLRSVPPGYIYQVIKNGYGAMPDHGDQIPVNDRWAIVAYLRALQLSRDANISDVPPDLRQQLGAK
jgi:mono/diheme cytochrome c family protein